MRSLSFPTIVIQFAVVAVAYNQSYAASPVSAPLKQSPSALRSGWVDVSSSGFKISLPADMQVKVLSQEQASEVADRATEKRLSDQKVLNSLRKDAANGQLKLVATLKRASSTGFHNALAVLVKPNAGSKTEDDVLKSNQEFLKKTSEPESVIGAKISLPCGPAVRIQSSKPRPGGATTAATTYLIIHANHYTCSAS